MDNFSVQKLALANGQALDFGLNDIVLVVGRNSSGKSTFLREIRSCVYDHAKSKKLIESAVFRGSTETDLRNRIYSTFRVITDGLNHWVEGERGNREFYLPSLMGGPSTLALGGASKAFVSLLNAEGRLSLTKDVETIDLYKSKPRHPFHVFMVEPEKLNRTSDVVKQAFGLELRINRIGNPIRGYVAAHFEGQDTLSSEKSLPDEAELLIDQGDGLRSFAGIVGEVDAMSHPIVLIDEPEAFLHPPQAKRLARNIVQSLGDSRQAFIATHDSNFLQGAIGKMSSRMRVIRLERSHDSFNVIDIRHTDLKQAEALPSLANTNLLDSLFYDQTIICEGDADCKLFDHLIADEQRDRFWFSASGKQQFHKVAQLLSGFGVNWAAILDLDVLLDWELLAKLASLKNHDVSRHKKRIAGALRTMLPPNLAGVRMAATSALAKKVDDATAIRDALKELDARKTSTPLKQYGLAAIPNGQERAHVEGLLNELSDVGILLLRKGQLESYVPTVGLHGPAWVNSVLADTAKYASELNALAAELEKVS